jgi:hypothetical protein
LRRNHETQSPSGLALGFLFLGFALLGQFFISKAGQPDSLWLGVGFYALSLFFLRKAFFPPPKAPSRFSEIAFPLEALLFIFILAVGLFFRLDGIHQYPHGVFADRAEVAKGALRILHDHWRPFLSALDLHVSELPIYYAVAGWFAAFGSSSQAYAYFDAALSTLGLLLSYVFFRQIIGTRAALTAFFILAVMRWNFAFAHQVYFQAQSVLFLSASLAAFYYALRTRSALYAAASGMAAAIGLYAYQACKAVPILIVVCMAFEFYKDPKAFKKNTRLWTALGAGFLILAAPYFYHTVQSGELGRREAEVSILTSIEGQKSPAPLAVNLKDQVLMFNRQADNNTQADYDRHPMLDDATGILFVLGFFYAAWRWRERPFFLSLAGVVIMSLPSYFSVDAGHAGRTLGATPFVALTAALLLEEAWRRWEIKPGPVSRAAVYGLSFLLLAFIAARNFHDYFEVQALNPVCQNDCSWTESRVGEIIERADDKTDFFLPSAFYGHPTVTYLARGRDSQMHPLDLSHLPKPLPGRALCFLLNDSKAATLDYLMKEYPGGQAQSMANPLGEISLYGYRVEASALAGLKPGATQVKRGLEGFYAHSDDSREKPFLVRWDPLINFNFRDLPGTGTPLFIHWRGSIFAPKAGDYSFLAVTAAMGEARLVIDGTASGDFTPNPIVEIHLAAGAHSLHLYFRQAPSALATVHLLWKKPGASGYEVIPNDFFGTVR